MIDQRGFGAIGMTCGFIVRSHEIRNVKNKNSSRDPRNMKLNLKALTACLLLCGLSSNIFAKVCTSTNAFGNLGPPALELFGHSFSSSGDFTDCYTFSISSSANAYGGVIEVDPALNRLDIDVTSVAVYSGGIVGGITTGALFGESLTPANFSFTGLSIGIYSLVVSTTVSLDQGLFFDPVSYQGVIETIAASPTDSPTNPNPNNPNPISVSEPSMAIMFAFGLAALAMAIRRRSIKQS